MKGVAVVVKWRGTKYGKTCCGKGGGYHTKKNFNDGVCTVIYSRSTITKKGDVGRITCGGASILFAKIKNQTQLSRWAIGAWGLPKAIQLRFCSTVLTKLYTPNVSALS
jgi:hypothetical protein